MTSGPGYQEPGLGPSLGQGRGGGGGGGVRSEYSPGCMPWMRRPSGPDSTGLARQLKKWFWPPRLGLLHPPPHLPPPPLPPPSSPPPPPPPLPSTFPQVSTFPTAQLRGGHRNIRLPHVQVEATPGHLAPPPPRHLATSPPPYLRAASVIGIPKISRYTDFFTNSEFLKMG